MPDLADDIHAKNKGLISGIFLTFSGNCKEALTFYQTCFGGTLQIKTFDEKLQGYTTQPVIIGSLVADRIIIHGSDLVHNEGRKTGNYISVFLQCANKLDRKIFIQKLQPHTIGTDTSPDDAQELIEVTDAFDVKWVLAVVNIRPIEW